MNTDTLYSQFVIMTVVSSIIFHCINENELLNTLHLYNQWSTEECNLLF